MKKLKLGLLLVGNESWMGGVYYALNIIRALSKLSEESVPDIYVFYSKEIPDELIDELRANAHVKLYPVFNQRFISRVVNAVSIRLFRYNWWLSKRFDALDLDVIYPFLNYDKTLRTKAIKLHWIPDFQHHFLPEYFKKSEIRERDEAFERIAKHAQYLVFSSEDAKSHFNTLYPKSKIAQFVFNFSSEAADIELLNRGEILEKYEVSKPYFIVSNQFWRHKNHRLVLEALVLSKAMQKDFEIIFTGKQEDYRHPEYVSEIFQFVKASKISNARFLGFISRQDQLSLMKHSIAVVQPSLFEGWGTVIEDAKALEVPVIASDIPIHREQLRGDGYYFKPDEPKALAKLMEIGLKDPSKLKSPDCFNKEPQLILQNIMKEILM